jgi:hypothetical protein
MEPKSLGLVIVALGALLVLVGLLVYSGGFSWFGRLPGDIRYESETTRIYVPITSMILLSLVLTVLANLLRRFF